MFKWLKDAKRVPELLRALEVLRTEHDRLHYDIKMLRLGLESANESTRNERSRADELEKKVRKQNEADLLLVSLQIVQRITAGEKKETPALQSLLNQQSVLSSYYQQQGPYSRPGDILAGLGLGGIFGPFAH